MDQRSVTVQCTDSGSHRPIYYCAASCVIISPHNLSPHFTPGPQSRSANFWSAFYPFAGPQVRSPHFTSGLTL